MGEDTRQDKVVVNHLTKRFGDLLVLNDINFTVKKAAVIAYDDLGTEAIRRLEIENLAAIVAIDAHGGNLFETGRAQYAITD